MFKCYSIVLTVHSASTKVLDLFSAFDSHESRRLSAEIVFVRQKKTHIRSSARNLYNHPVKIVADRDSLETSIRSMIICPLCFTSNVRLHNQR